MRAGTDQGAIRSHSQHAILGADLFRVDQVDRPRTTTGLQAVIPQEAPLTLVDLYEAVQKTRFEILALREELDSRTFLGRLRRLRVWLRQTFWRF